MHIFAPNFKNIFHFLIKNTEKFVKKLKAVEMYPSLKSEIMF